MLFYVVLYGYLYGASHRRLFRGAFSVAGKWKEVLKLRRGAGDIPCNIPLQSAGPTTAKRSTGPRYKKIASISRTQRTRGARQIAVYT